LHREEKKVFIGKQFFAHWTRRRSSSPRCWRFAAGFIVRPFGALVFGRLGDMIGRKYTFLVTILIMGLSTFIVGILPGYASIGVAAPDHPGRSAHPAGPGARR
jgi:MFS family permease